MSKQITWSKIAVIIIAGTICIGRVWKKEPNPISWDTAGYYLYLPATLIYHDPGLDEFARYDSLRVKYDFSSTFYQVSRSPANHNVIRYTGGTSIMQAPFFLIGHGTAMLLGYETDGFSMPYQICLKWGALIYGLIALMFLRKILRHYLSERATILSLVLIVFGTNLFNQLSMNNLEVHNFQFFLISVFLWSTIRFWESPGYKRLGITALIGGLIILVRPTDIAVWLVFGLWGVSSWRDFKERLFNHYKYVLIFGFIASFIFIPQLIYWKNYAGSWLYNSYNNPGEGLDFLNPHTFEFLWSYRKGWLVYTPLGYLLIASLLLLWKTKRDLLLPLLGYFLLHVYISSSWTCWWYAGSFSSRAMVQSYAILVLPLGFFIQRLLISGKYMKLLVGSLLVLLIGLNLFQTWQYSHRLLKPDRMTRAYYWEVFGKVRYNKEYSRLLLKDKVLDEDTIFSIQPYRLNLLKQVSIENENLADSLNEYIRLDSSRVFYTIYEEKVVNITSKYFGYIRVKGEVLSTENLEDNSVELIRTMNHKGGLYAYRSNPISTSYSDSLGVWLPFTYDYVLPDVRTKNDVFKTYFWLRGDAPVYFKNIQVIAMEPLEFPELK